MEKITEGLLSLEGRLQDGRIVLEFPAAVVGDWLQEGKVVLVDGVFTPAAMTAMRQSIIDWAQDTDAFPQGQSASVPGINFHRRDDGSVKSSLPHVFAQYGFGDFSRLPSSLGSRLLHTAQALLALQNEVAETAFELGVDSSLRCKTINHPSGGGFLAGHVHPYQPMKVAIFLSLSSQGVDYRQGSLTFDTSAWGRVDVAPYFSTGKFVLFRYDLPHEVTPVDPQATLDWNSAAGLWMLSLELVESHGRSHLA